MDSVVPVDSSVTSGHDLTDGPPPALMGHRPSFSFATDGYFASLGSFSSAVPPLQPMPTMPSLPLSMPNLQPGIVNSMSPILMHRSSWSNPTHLGGPDPSLIHPVVDGDGGEVYQHHATPSPPTHADDEPERMEPQRVEETSDEDKRHWGTGRKKIQIEFIQVRQSDEMGGGMLYSSLVLCRTSLSAK